MNITIKQSKRYLQKTIVLRLIPVCVMHFLFSFHSAVLAHQLGHSSDCNVYECATPPIYTNSHNVFHYHDSNSEPQHIESTRARLSIIENAQNTMIAVERAENALIRDCMQAQGFKFFGPTDPALNEKPDSLLELLNPGEALNNGYASYVISANADVDLLQQQEAEYINSLSEADREQYVRTLTGGDDTDYIEIETSDGLIFSTESGGCMRDAMSKLFGAEITQVMGLFFELQQLANADHPVSSRVQKSELRWASCMSASGYSDLQRPADSISRGIELRSKTGSLTLEERNLATTDAYCRIESEIIESARRQAAINDDNLIASHESLVSKWNEYEQQMLNNVRAIRTEYGLADDIATAQINDSANDFRSWCVCKPAIHRAMHFASEKENCC